MTLGKTKTLPQILTFCLARGFDWVLSLGVKTPLITPVMGISDLVVLGKFVLICWRAKDFQIWSDFFQVRDILIGSTLVNLCEIWLGSSWRGKLWDNQERLTRTLVLLAPLLALGSKSTSVSSGIQLCVEAVWYDMFSLGFSSLFQHVYLVITYLRAEFQVYLS